MAQQLEASSGADRDWREGGSWLGPRYTIREGGGLLYVQLANDLRRCIAEGRLAAGEPLPTVPELMNAYEVSRATVKGAVGLLYEWGFLDPEPGHRTLVRRAEQPRDVYHPIEDRDVRTGDEAEYRTTGRADVPATADLASLFKVALGAELAMWTSWKDKVPGLVPIYRSRRYRLPGGTSDQISRVLDGITARLPSDLDRHQFGVDRMTTLLNLRSVCMDGTGSVIEVVDTNLVGERASLAYDVKDHRRPWRDAKVA